MIDSARGGRIPAAAYAMGIGMLVIAGAAIRWHNIGDYSLWLDELSQVVVATSPFPDILAEIRSHAAAAPLDYLGAWVVVSALGDATFWVRLWPFMAGVATIVLTERMASELFASRRAGFAAAVLTVPAGFLVFYSQEARFYALAAATAAAVVWTFSRADRLRRTRDWALFGLASLAAVYTHYFAVLLIAAVGLWLVMGAAAAWWRHGRTAQALRSAARSVVPFAAASVAVGLALAPWYAYATAGQLSITYAYPAIPDLTFDRVLRIVTVLLAAVPSAPTEVGDAPTDLLLALSILGLAFVGAAAAARRRPVVVGALLTYGILLIPVVWAADQRAGYFVSERQFISLVPMLLALAGGGIAVIVGAAGSLGRRLLAGPGVARWPAVVEAGLAVMLLIGFALASVAPLNRVYALEFRPKEDWRRASTFVAEAACPDGRIYSNVPDGYGYGIAIYRPELGDRTEYLQETDQNEWVQDVIERYPIARRDTIVIFRDRPGVFVAGRGTIDTVSDYLARRGFRYQTFTERIRVFVTTGACSAAPAT